MKYLVFLLLVAVCQGVVLRDSPRSQRVHERIEDISNLQQSRESPNVHIGFDQLEQRIPLGKTIRLFQKQRENREHEQYPVKRSILGKNLEKSLFHPPIDVDQWDKSVQPMPFSSPFIQYIKPQTFMYYLKTFRNQPWSPVTSVYPDVLDFKTFKDLIQFPGGDFLQNEIDKCLWNMREDQKVPVYWPTKEFKNLPRGLEIDLTRIQGVRDVLPYIVTKLEKIVPLYMQTTSDPSTMAMLVTRDLIKIVLHGRMKCPTTTWDKYFIENVNDQLNKITNDEKYQLLENFKTLLPEAFPEFSGMTNQLEYTITQDVQLQVYKDVVQYAHGVAFKDVAIVSHKLYHELKRVLEDSWQRDVPTFMEQLVTVVTEVITDYGMCPKAEILGKNTLACWDFNKLFLERELANIHSRVMNIIHHFLYSKCTAEDCTQFYPRLTEVCKTIIGRYISTIVQRVTMCRTPECLDPTECLVNRYPFQEPSRVVQIETRIPSWRALLNKIGKTRYL